MKNIYYQRFIKSSVNKSVHQVDNMCAKTTIWFKDKRFC